MTTELKEVAVDKLAAEKLKNYIESIENCELKKKEINENIKEFFDEAKASGYDIKIMRKIIALRKKNKLELEEEEYLLETYKEALGMVE